jgi:peptidoglycan/xylan/chitin deacetylase (PgdA/CDA1 family)
LVRLSQEERRSELTKGRDALGPRSNAFIRPPYGHYDIECARDVHALGMRCVMWTRHISDWEPASVETLTERLRKAVVPGNIVLLHEALYTATPENRQDRESMLEAVDTVLGETAGKVRFGTLSELLKSGRPVLQLVTRHGDDEFIEAQRPGSVQEERQARDDILTP